MKLGETYLSYSNHAPRESAFVGLQLVVDSPVLGEARKPCELTTADLALVGLDIKVHATMFTQTISTRKPLVALLKGTFHPRLAQICLSTLYGFAFFLLYTRFSLRLWCLFPRLRCYAGR